MLSGDTFHVAGTVLAVSLAAIGLRDWLKSKPLNSLPLPSEPTRPLSPAPITQTSHGPNSPIAGRDQHIYHAPVTQTFGPVPLLQSLESRKLFIDTLKSGESAAAKIVSVSDGLSIASAQAIASAMRDSGWEVEYDGDIENRVPPYPPGVLLATRAPAMPASDLLWKALWDSGAKVKGEVFDDFPPGRVRIVVSYIQ